MTLDEAIEYYIKAATQRELADEEKGDYDKWNETRFMTKKQSIQIIADHRQLAEWLKELKEAKRLLKAAVEDFAKLDRENTRDNNCMIREMGCGDCPLNWDSVDDSVEPCHNWRYTDEAEKLLNDEK